jgi:diguanylate cyclase (GGDEF)-like protein
MSTAPEYLNSASPLPQAAVVVPPSQDRWGELCALLRELETSGGADPAAPVLGLAGDERLVRARLGVASGLFTALQCKNAVVAARALREAVACSGWAMKLNLAEADRDAIEIAALLHDIGIVGVPDHILLNSDAPEADRAVVMTRARKASLEILHRSGSPAKVLEIVGHLRAWYDGSDPAYRVSGDAIPLGSRMIAIVEAYDAMITDGNSRPAAPRERALSELFARSGTQFDPELVRQFQEFCQEDQAVMRCEVAHRWLTTLDPAASDAPWAGRLPGADGEPTIDGLFHGRLLDNMYDAVVFIDAQGRVTHWNRGAERLTGVGGGSVCGQPWQDSLLELSDEKGQPVHEADSPVYTAIHCGAQSLRRLRILGRGQRRLAVDCHAIPVIDRKGVTHGAVLLFHDASSEISLEQRCQSLHEKATKDPLTQVANRAEFDRVHAMFVAAHQQQRVPCGLIMCDLDHFKLVNDTYGHQAGDEAIKSLASLLKSSCRPGDLVARYGGEEFVMLCADCDNATATSRADQVRKSLSQLSQASMEGRTVTCSFGVTEIQPGDTPETMLRRADRALLMAKSNGRNTVVPLGINSSSDDLSDGPQSAYRSSGSGRPRDLIERDLVTPVPVKMAIEKLRGFVADHRARIISVDSNRVQLEIDDRPLGRFRRFTERPTTFSMDLRFEEERVKSDRSGPLHSVVAGTTRTRIKIAIGPRTNRDRRRKGMADKAKQVLASLRSYLMAIEEDPPATGAMTSVKRILGPWLG